MEEEEFNINEFINNDLIETGVNQSGVDKFFSSLIDGLNNKKNLSMKTEYRNVNENNAGIKLEFLASLGNIPYLKNYIDIFETKRVSLERKGRMEDIMILQQREKEKERESAIELNKRFGI